MAALLALSSLGVSVPAGAVTDARSSEVPKNVSLVDPAGDANYLNTQRLVVRRGDVSTPADASGAADVLALWFTHDRKTVTAHIQTEAPVNPSESAYVFRVHIDPGSGTGCLWFEAITAGPNNPDGPHAVFADTCNSGATWEATVGMRPTFTELPDGTGLVRIEAQRKMHPLLREGGVLGDPFVDVRNYHFGEVTAPVIDETVTGKPYEL